MYSNFYTIHYSSLMAFKSLTIFSSIPSATTTLPPALIPTIFSPTLTAFMVPCIPATSMHFKFSKLLVLFYTITQALSGVFAMTTPFKSPRCVMTVPSVKMLQRRKSVSYKLALAC